MSIRLLNGVEQNQKHPDTFLIPSEGEKARIRAGDLVKVHLTGMKDDFPTARGNTEKFWVTVVAKDGNNITGLVNNDLVYTQYHGYDDGSEISFNVNNVINIWYQNWPLGPVIPLPPHVPEGNVGYSCDECHGVNVQKN